MGNTKIANFHMVIVGKKEVLGLDVAMNDLVEMN